jgi:hypothetical protein
MRDIFEVRKDFSLYGQNYRVGDLVRFSEDPDGALKLLVQQGFVLPGRGGRLRRGTGAMLGYQTRSV